PAPDGGVVVLLADAGLAPVQAVVRHDPAGFAGRELAEREALRLPPAWRVAELVGRPSDVTDLLALARLPSSATVLGPVPVEDGASRRRRAQPRDGGSPPREPSDPAVRALVSVPQADGAELAAGLRAAAGIRSARKEGAAVAVRIDPTTLA